MTIDIHNQRLTTYNLKLMKIHIFNSQFTIPKFLNDPEESDYHESHRIIKTYQKF